MHSEIASIMDIPLVIATRGREGIIGIASGDQERCQNPHMVSISSTECHYITRQETENKRSEHVF
jgi:hypothetical protein